MKRKTSIVIFSILAFTGISAWNNMAMSDSSGASAGFAGVPGERNCTFCHSGTASTVPGLITSDIDTAGYVPGMTYTITASITGTKNVFGFEICPKANAGTKHGTVKVTNATDSRISVSSGKQYITHTRAGTAGTNNSRKWTFQWVAPAAGSGNITFYGAFNASNANGSSSGDKISLSNLTVKENTATAGLAVYGAAAGKLGIFPNPAHEVLNYTLILDKPSVVNASLTDVAGHTITLISNRSMNSGVNYLDHSLSGLAAGIYILHVTAAEHRYVEKLLIQ